jgi:hypothetical protein
MVPTQRQCPKNRHRSRCQWRQNPREQNDRDKGSEEYGPKKTPTFRPSDLHGNQLGADNLRIACRISPVRTHPISLVEDHLIS